MNTKSAAAKIADTAAAVSPAKPKRVRATRPKSTVARTASIKAQAAAADAVAPVGIEEAALAKLAKLAPSDFYLKPILILNLLDDGGLTITPIDVASGARLDLPGSSIPIEVQPGPVYKLGKSALADLFFILEGKYRDADAEHTRVVEALVRDLDAADMAKQHAESLAEAAVANAAAAAGKTAEALARAEDLQSKVTAKSITIVEMRTSNSNLRASQKTDAARIAELELQLASALFRPPLLKRLRAVVVPAGRA